MAKHPRDPRVALAAACSVGSTANSPAATQERRQWLDAFKQSAPDNALAFYLSARDHFKSGQPELAEQEVLAAGAKTMRDYAADWLENTEEAYHSAGYSEAEAKALAMTTLLMPHLANLREVGTELVTRAHTTSRRARQPPPTNFFKRP